MTNREVYAVPGNITSRNSFGTNYLIKSAGAKLVQTWQDIVSEFPAEVAARILPPGLKGEEAPAAVSAPADLSAAERRVWSLLSTDEPMHIDALAQAAGMGVPELTAALLGLELRELVKQLPGRYFVKQL